MKPKESRILRWMEALLAVMTLVVASLMMIQCVRIYMAGTAPSNLTEAGVRIHDIYSREIVAAHWQPVAVPALVWLVLLVICGVARLVLPREKGRLPAVEPEVTLSLLRARRENTEAMRKEQHGRSVGRIVCLVWCLVCAALAGVYLLDVSHFTSWDLEQVMGQMLLHVAPPTVAAFAALMALSAWEERSVRREINAAKQAPIKKGAAPADKQQGRGVAIGRVCLYAAAIALVVLGVLNGGMYDVLVKAINICTECIGLG